MNLFFVLIFLITSNYVKSSNILCIYPRPAYSHQNVFRAITEELLERGHHVTLLSTHPNENEKTHQNVTLIDSSSSAYIFKEAMNDVFQRKITGFRRSIFHMIDSEAKLVESQLSSETFQKILKLDKGHFDVIILEAAGFSPYHALAEKFSAPIIGISSADTFSMVHETMGNPANPVAHPERIISFTIARTFLQRLGSCFLNAIVMKFIVLPHTAEVHSKILMKHFPEIEKSHEELVENFQFLMINAHPALGFVRPILANTIQLGFLHIKPPKPLDIDLKSLLDNSKNGAIFMSFGTVITTEMFQKNYVAFLEAFSQIPYDVFWKYDGDELQNIPSNVHIRKWFPQSDLLAHENVKLFITHGGLHSIEESISRRIPMVVCPFHGDQSGNTERILKKGIAKSLNIHKELKSDEIIEAIQAVIRDESYKGNIVKLAELVEDVPMSSVEKAVWHIEFIIRHKGAQHLKYEQKEIPFYQFHYFDVIFVVFAISLCVLIVCYWLTKKIFKCLYYQTTRIYEDKKNN